MASNISNPGRTGGVSADNPIKVMLVDDSAVIRGLISRMITPEPDMEVTASVGDGQRAIDTLTRNPDIDVILLDIEMPVMDGLTALPKLMAQKPGLKIIMASTLTLENAEVSMRAMKLGAVDYIPKPTSTREISGGQDFREELVAKVRAVTGRLAPRAGAAQPAAPAAATPAAAAAPAKKPLYPGPVTLRPAVSTHRKPQIIAVGSSTGGPQALFEVMKGIDASVQMPIVLTQHMPPKFTTILAQHIQQAAGRPCAEAQDGEPLQPGRIYVAPGDFHMTVQTEGTGKVLRLNQDPPENFCRPAVDPMFRSVAAAFGDRVLGIVLTGMGSDGAKGGKILVDGGATVIAQDEASSVVWGMPGAAAQAGICSALLPLTEVAGYVNKYVGEGLP